MFCTSRIHREYNERRAIQVAVIGPGYTLDISKHAAAIGVERGALRKHTDGYYYVQEPFGYCAVLDLPNE